MSRLPVLAVAAAAALIPAAGASAATPFEFQPGPASPFGNAVAGDANGDVWLTTYRSGVPGKVLVSVRRADGTVRLVTTYTAPAGYATLAPKIAVRNGLATVAFSRYKGSSGIRAMAIRCKATGCGRAQEVGRAQRVKTEATPVIDQYGRSLVLWRGTASNGPRLQWAITTNGRFGKVHTLGGFGIDLTATPNPLGGVLAAWVDGGDGIRLSGRSRGEFSRPGTLGQGPSADPQLAVAGRDVIAAWRSGKGDGEGDPGAGAVHVSVRPSGLLAFGPIQTVFAGNGRDLVLAADGAGGAVLAFADAGANPSGTFLATQNVSTRQPSGAFGVPVALGTGPLYSAPAVTVAGGRVFAAWMSQTDLQQPARIKAAELQQGGAGPAVDLGPGSAPLAAPGPAGPVFAWAGPKLVLGFAP